MISPECLASRPREPVRQVVRYRLQGGLHNRRRKGLTTMPDQQPRFDHVDVPLSTQEAKPDGLPANALLPPTPLPDGPGRLYAFVVISLAIFMIGLTFFCRPAVHYRIVGEAGILRQKSTLATPDDQELDWIDQHHRRAEQTLRQLVTDQEVWQGVLDEIRLLPDSLPLPRADITPGSLPDRYARNLTLTLEHSRPEFAVRILNRYLQTLIDQFEQRDPADLGTDAVVAADRQVRQLESEREHFQTEVDRLQARLEQVDARLRQLSRKDAGADVAQTPPTPDLLELEAPVEVGPPIATVDEADTVGEVNQRAEQADDADSELAELQAERELLAAQSQHFENLLAESSRSLDAAVDLKRDLKAKVQRQHAAHLVIVRPAGVVARRADSVAASQILWLLLPSLVVGAGIAWMIPRRSRQQLLTTVGEVEALSPYPVIVLWRRDPGPAVLQGPHRPPQETGPPDLATTGP